MSKNPATARKFLLNFTLICDGFKVLKLNKMSYYAVAKGRTSGIFMNWADCEAQVKGYSGARYKKFNSAESALAFISSNGGGSGGSSLPVNQKQYNNAKTNSYNNNLKRTYSTTQKPTHKKASKRKSKGYTEFSDSEDSDDSDGINEILTKQMDDIEQRLKGFEKGVDKIFKKSTTASHSGATGSGRKAILLVPPQPKKRRTSNANFQEDNEGFVQVYTDGACSANGRSGARAGLGVYWGDGHSLNLSEPVSGRATNNCGEIQAATAAIKVALDNGIKKLSINTDSKFLINSVTKWMPGWKRKGWKLQSGEPVKNEVDFKDLDSVQNKLQIKWNYVEAHRGIHGNEMADQLAKAGAANYK